MSMSCQRKISFHEMSEMGVWYIRMRKYLQVTESSRLFWNRQITLISHLKFFFSPHLFCPYLSSWLCVYVSAVQPLLSQSPSAAGPLLTAAPPAGASWWHHHCTTAACSRTCRDPDRSDQSLPGPLLFKLELKTYLFSSINNDL